MNKFNYQVFKALKKEVFAEHNFYSYKTIAIGHHELFGRNLDSGLPAFNSLPSFQEYCYKIQSFRSIQVLGLENNKKLMQLFQKYKNLSYYKLIDVCLFYSPRKTYSFDRHWDDYHGLLYVVKGQKKIILGKKIKYVYPGEFIEIKKGIVHQIFNCKETWSISFAYA